MKAGSAGSAGATGLSRLFFRDCCIMDAMQSYPTRFYGRTWLYWMGIPLLGTLVAFWLIFGLQIVLGIEPTDDPEMGFVLIILGLILAPAVFVCVFQVYARQMPILKIYREGMVIRTIGAPVQADNLVLIVLWVFGLWIIILPLIALWQCITLQTFRIQTIRVRWEKIVTILPDKRSLTIAGWFEKIHSSVSERDTSAEFYHAVSYDTASFGTSIGNVIEAVVFNAFNPDSREVLPSWQGEESMFVNDTYDF